MFILDEMIYKRRVFKILIFILYSSHCQIMYRYVDVCILQNMQDILWVNFQLIKIYKWVKIYYFKLKENIFALKEAYIKTQGNVMTMQWHGRAYPPDPDSHMQWSGMFDTLICHTLSSDHSMLSRLLMQMVLKINTYNCNWSFRK